MNPYTGTKTSVFVRPQVQHGKPIFLKNLHSEARYGDRFYRTLVTTGQTGGKNFRFQAKR